MTKPRIVREHAHSVHPGSGFLAEQYAGSAYLALLWPECPYTPEAVMAACERCGWTMATVPYFNGIEWMVRWTWDGTEIYCKALTPEFMGEQKKCAHEIVDWSDGPHGQTCAMCGAILSDRRVEQRRKGERRKIGATYAGGRRRPYHSLHIDRRCHGIDRRKGTSPVASPVSRKYL